ncbi:VOC family protein [Actimicrobium antarcticum]|uniref:VOC family protein n=1 Tax=Actimicrobium antarcticum TaxID=1051899 RepID=A0ABP7SXE1_9BURK
MTSVTRLGYIGLNVTDIAAWEPILIQVLGFEPRPQQPGEALQLRMDDRHHRFTLYPAESNSFAYVGWEVDTRDDFFALYDKLTKNQVPVVKGTSEEKRERAVMELMRFPNPDGAVQEIFFGGVEDNQPFRPSRAISGYRTGEQGLGHILFAAADAELTVNFYREQLGFRLSDYIHWDDAQATFMHCNPRHHSLAITNPCFGTGPGELNHFMVQANSIDDVGRGYDLVQQLGIPLILTLGKHTNDKMTSFYMITPAGFAIEYGFGACEIDDKNWEVKFYNAPKIWGHNLVTHD